MSCQNLGKSFTGLSINLSLRRRGAAGGEVMQCIKPSMLTAPNGSLTSEPNRHSTNPSIKLMNFSVIAALIGEAHCG
jgi:hypothetical protein